MHHMKLKAAVAKYRPMKAEGKSDEDILTAIKLDENGYDDDQAAEILAAVNAEVPDQAPPPPPSPNLNDQSNAGNSLPDPLAALASIDYNNLKGEAFKKYVAIVGDRSFVVLDEETGQEKQVVGQLQQDKEYDFELYRAKPIRRPRYVGVKDSPMDFVGIELVNTKPEHKTRIPVKVALEANAQILNQHSIAGHGRYYLLVKK